MGKKLLENYPNAKKFLNEADSIVGFPLSQIMAEGTEDDLRQTKVTQPAIYTYSIILYNAHSRPQAQAFAGHSLGEFTALAASGLFSDEKGLELVSIRANAMEKACQLQPSTMAAVLGMDDDTLNNIIAGITDEVVVGANYNSPGQVVISGSIPGIEIATEKLKSAGAKRVVPLVVGGAFHSPLMEPARLELEEAVLKTSFSSTTVPIYQNVDGKKSVNATEIKEKLIAQLTSPVLWTRSIENMVADGCNEFIECGPGNVLQGLVKKINRDVTVSGL